MQSVNIYAISPSFLFVHRILAGPDNHLTPKTQTSIGVVRRMGYTDEKIREALTQLPEQNVDVENLIDVLFDLNFREDHETSSPQTDSCILCSKNSASSLFLPCRPLVICSECATETCPKCQTYVAGSIRVYRC